MGIGLIYPYAWPLGMFGVGLSIWQLSKKQKWQQRYVGMFSAWTLKSLCAVTFFWSIYPIEWLPTEIGKASLLIIGLCWFGVGVSLGTGGLWLVGLLHLSKYLFNTSHRILALMLPFIWVVAEILGSYMFSFFSIGPGGTINSYFSFGYVGYLLAQHSILLQFAMIAGVYSLIVLAVAIAIGFLFLIKEKRWWSVSFAVLLILVSSTMELPLPKNETTQKTVGVITTTYPVKKMFERESFTALQTIQQEAFDAAVSESPDYVLWPEDARFIDQAGGIEQSKNVFSFLNPEVETIVVDSGRVPYKDSAILQGIVFDTVTNNHEVVHKRFLVPQGEFIPSLYEFILQKLNFSSLVDDLTSLVSYRIGPLTNQGSLLAKYPGILFCFEGISPVGVRQIMNEREYTPFIAHPISHSWFHEPKEVWHQLDASLKVQAVWNQVTIVSPANNATSKVYFSDGSIKTLESDYSGRYWEVSVLDIPIK